MIQWGSGLFEYNIDDELVLSGKICYLHETDLNSKSDLSLTLDEKPDNIHGIVLKYEIYTILENNGYTLGENFKNISNFHVYKNDIRGNVNWNNDWIYFLDSLLQFPLLENLGTSHEIEAPISIRQISITPGIIDKNIKKGLSQILIYIINYE